MDTKKAQQLLQKYREGTLSLEEKIILDGWLLQLSQKENIDLSQINLEEKEAALFNRLDQRINQQTTKSLWPRIAVAASVLIALSFGGYEFLHQRKTQQVATNQSHELLPATNHAILKTGSGQLFVLNNLPKGIIKSNINKTAAEELTYNNKAANENAVAVYDTLVVPRGGKAYHLVLADGTDTWLNAGTIFRYPEKFTGGKREVQLISGEMLFKVAYNAANPFLITTHGQVLKDLGTQFNVNAYDDEPVVQTTLLEGSVSVSKGDKSLTLLPGQAVRVNNQTSIFSLDKNANTEMAIAWRNGLFEFDNTPIKEVMRQLARWYDVNIVYEGDIPDRSLTGKLYRDINASQLLDVLSYNKIHYHIDGKTLTIMP